MTGWTPEKERAIAAAVGGWFVVLTVLEAVLGI